MLTTASVTPVRRVGESRGLGGLPIHALRRSAGAAWRAQADDGERSQRQHQHTADRQRLLRAGAHVRVAPLGDESADFGVGAPGGERLAGCRKDDVSYLTGCQVNRSRRSQFDPVRQMNFDPDPT